MDGIMMHIPTKNHFQYRQGHPFAMADPRLEWLGTMTHTYLHFSLLKPSARLLYECDPQIVKTITLCTVPEASGHVAIGALPCQTGLDNVKITLSSTCEHLVSTPCVGH